MREQRSHPLTLIREQQNLTQDRLAEVARISARTIMRAENNRPIGAESRRRLCEYFAMTAEELGLQLPRSLATPEVAMEEEEVRIDIARENTSERSSFFSLPTTPQQDEISSYLADTVAQKMTGAIHQLEGVNNQNMNPVRRTTIAGLLSLMSGATVSLEWWERLASPHPTALNAHTFLYFQQLLETGWGLSNVGELQSAEHVLMGFLPKMIQLAPRRHEAALLAAEGLRLHGILLAHQQRLLDKLTVCLQAVEYARQAKNVTILIAQLTELAVAFKYACQPMNSFHTYQEALSYCNHKEISPLVRSRIYAASAATSAKNGYLREAYSSLDQAYETFPTQLENEPIAFSADNKIFMIDYYQGLLHLVAHQPKKASKTFEQSIAQSSENQMPERWRLIILNYQGLASILSKQQEQYAWCLEEGISGALALGSKKRFDEALYIYQHEMPEAWRTEPRIKQIAERFQLERESRREEELEI